MTYREWIELIEANRDEIIEKGIEVFKDSYGYIGLSGWFVGVEISSKGNVYTIGPMSRGSMTISLYEGNSARVLTFSTHEYEFDRDISDYVIDDIKDFKRYLINEYNLDPDGIDFEDDLNREINMFNYSQFNPERYQEFEKEDFEWYVDEYGRQIVEEELDNTLRNLEDEVSYEEED